MLIFDELQTAFPWYNKIEKLNRYKPRNGEYCDYKLISPRDALLPFQFRRATTKKVPTNWSIYNANTDLLVVDITAQLSKIHYRTIGDFDYLYYDGSALAGLNLDYGFYYSRLTFATGVPFFSEMFHIPESRFAVGDSDIPYLKLEWYNTKNIDPFYFEDQPTDEISYFKNVVYLDSFVHMSEPEIAEEGTKDGEDEIIPTFQKASINYRITVLVPDFLKIALVLMQMHDSKFLTDAGGIRSGEIKNISTNSSAEQGGVFSTVDLIFSQDLLIINTNCPQSIGEDTGTTGWS